MSTSVSASVLNSVASASVQRTSEASNRAASGRVERDRDEEAGRTQGARRGGQVFKALAQTLSDFGVAAPAKKGAPPATESQANDVENAASQSAQSQSRGPALQGFMHSLFQTLSGNASGNPQAQTSTGSDADNDNDATSAVTSRGRRAYGDLEGRLQNLVQSLGSSTSSATGEAAATTTASGATELEAAFQNLSKAMQSSGNTGSANVPDLQAFLSTLQKNLQNAGSHMDSSGNLVNTHA